MARPRIDRNDAAKRYFVQLRLYGDIAKLVDERAQREGKARATLVEELMRIAWAVPTDGEPLEPQHRFERVDLPGNVYRPPRIEAPAAPPVHRARVFSPPPARRPGFR